MKLSDQILDAIDGAEETRGRDSRYSEWAATSQALEDALRDTLALIDVLPSVYKGPIKSRLEHAHAALAKAGVQS